MPYITVLNAILSCPSAKYCINPVNRSMISMPSHLTVLMPILNDAAGY